MWVGTTKTRGSPSVELPIECPDSRTRRGFVPRIRFYRHVAYISHPSVLRLSRETGFQRTTKTYLNGNATTWCRWYVVLDIFLFLLLLLMLFTVTTIIIIRNNWTNSWRCPIWHGWIAYFAFATIWNKNHETKWKLNFMCGKLRSRFHRIPFAPRTTNMLLA